jgi:hypothetical protein
MQPWGGGPDDEMSTGVAGRGSSQNGLIFVRPTLVLDRGWQRWLPTLMIVCGQGLDDAVEIGAHFTTSMYMLVLAVGMVSYGLRFSQVLGHTYCRLH